MSDNYSEETRPLFKLLRNPAFRFVIVRYNHYSLVRRLADDLRSLFPDRQLVEMNAARADYQEITTVFFGMRSGFLLLDQFEDVLSLSHDSQEKESKEIQVSNERRRGITAGLNLRRDKLAQVPNALILLLRAADNTLFGKAIMEKMPDLWSFRSLIVNLEKRLEIAREIPLKNRQTAPEHVLNHLETEASEAELKRLIALVNTTPQTETTYLSTLWPQIADQQEKLGRYEDALNSLEAWEQIAENQDLGDIWFRHGTILQLLGNLTDSEQNLLKAKDFFESNGDHLNLVRSILSLGDIQLASDNLEQAQSWFENALALTQHLLKNAPDNQDYGYLAGKSYERIGNVYLSLGKLTHASDYFEACMRITEDLYLANPQNALLKNGLAVSYERLGEVYRTLGLIEKALGFFEKYNLLERELSNGHPQSILYKNNLASSFGELGTIHISLGNLEKALGFFHEFNLLIKDLHENFPQNLSFKNELATSHANLAQAYSGMGRSDLSLIHFQQAEKLWQELTTMVPQYAKFHHSLAQVRKDLSELQLGKDN